MTPDEMKQQLFSAIEQLFNVTISPAEGTAPVSDPAPPPVIVPDAPLSLVQPEPLLPLPEKKSGASVKPTEPGHPLFPLDKHDCDCSACEEARTPVLEWVQDTGDVQ